MTSIDSPGAGLADAERVADASDAAVEQGGGRRRKKLWELPHGYHCPVVGTCLTLDECEKLMQRARLRLVAADEFGVALHSYIVKQAAAPNPLSRATQKMLDRKYAVQVQRFSRLADDDELLLAWSEALNEGRIAGAFWAVVTHPAASRGVCDSVFGVVHMMSHLQGSDSRARERRAAQLARDNDRLQAELSRTRQRADQGRQELIARLREKDSEIVAVRAQLAQAEASRQRPVSPDRRQVRAVELSRRLKAERARARRAEAEAEALRASAQALRAELRRARAAAWPAPEPVDSDARVLPGPELPDDLLSGRTLLYVGGSVSQRPRLRDLVERHGGSFVYHDGGFEDGYGRLEGLIHRADAVFCPVDCVSHAACLQVKVLCRRLSRAFLPLRSRGTASFARAVAAHYAGGDTNAAALYGASSIVR